MVKEEAEERPPTENVPQDLEDASEITATTAKSFRTSASTGAGVAGDGAGSQAAGNFRRCGWLGAK